MNTASTLGCVCGAVAAGGRCAPDAIQIRADLTGGARLAEAGPPADMALWAESAAANRLTMPCHCPPHRPRRALIFTMQMTSMQTTDDYRLSHVDRGGNYDAFLAETPFDAYMAEWEDRHLPQIIRRLFPNGVPRYLDFACGTGRITATIAPLCRESVAVDISPSMIEVARQKLPGTTFHLCDLTQSELELGNFDLISSFRFFGNAQDDLREKVMHSLVERLAPGGYLVINNHRNPRALYALFDRLSGGDSGVMDLHLPKLRSLLGRHGLRIKLLQPIGAWMYRARLLGAVPAGDARAAAKERRYGHRALSAVAPDVIVVAQRR